MRVIVTGGRHFGDRALLFDTLDGLGFPPSLVVVHGCASGADTLAGVWARRAGRAGRDVREEKHPADWSQGLGAGHARNQRMADGGAALCIAFPGGAGTEDMIRRAEAAGISVFRVTKL